MAQISIVPETIRLVRMSDDDYFAEEEHISNSRLSLINPEEGGSIELFDLNPKSDYSDSFALGSAIHGKILQPDDIIISDIEKPNGKLGLFAEEMYKLRSKGMPIYKAIPLASITANYYANKLSNVRLKTAIRNSLPFYLQRIKVEDNPDLQMVFLSSSIREKYQLCLNNITAISSDILKLLYPEGLLSPPEIFNEYAIFCDIEYVDTETGEINIIKFKGKLDNFTINHETQTITLNDLKTTGKPINYFMGNYVPRVNQTTSITENVWYNGSFQNYHYYRQMAIYLWLLQAAITKYYGYKYKLQCNMLVVETIPEYACKVFPINGKQIQYGLDEFKNLLKFVVEWTQTK